MKQLIGIGLIVAALTTMNPVFFIVGGTLGLILACTE